MIDKKVSGVFHWQLRAVNPLYRQADTRSCISDYVLAGYGTGAIMAVPKPTTRATMPWPVTLTSLSHPLIEGCDVSEQQSFDAKSGKIFNSAFGRAYGSQRHGGHERAIAATKKFIEEKGIGRVKVGPSSARRHLLASCALLGRAFPLYIIRKASLPPHGREQAAAAKRPRAKYLPTETGELAGTCC